LSFPESIVTTRVHDGFADRHERAAGRSPGRRDAGRVDAVELIGEVLGGVGQQPVTPGFGVTFWWLHQAEANAYATSSG
jgi:hypothetical protein